MFTFSGGNFLEKKKSKLCKKMAPGLEFSAKSCPRATIPLQWSWSPSLFGVEMHHADCRWACRPHIRRNSSHARYCI